MAQIFHTLNRGVDKRKIFLDDQDYFRFIHDLFEFNDENRVNTTFYHFKRCNDIASRKIERKKRKLLVEIHTFCLMPNHYHLLISPKIENGVSKFMKKLNMGYAKYFNQKYERKGALFEGRYKSIIVTDEAHFVHLPYYIHLNPLDLKFPEWRNGMIKNHKGALEFLENYRWSSYLDYIGKKNFPSVTYREFLSECLGSPKQYEKNTIEWLRGADFETIKDLTLEI
jgi:putative transposase